MTGSFAIFSGVLLAATALSPCAAFGATDDFLDGSLKLNGSVGVEERIFLMHPSYAEQDDGAVQTSLMGTAELNWTSANKAVDMNVKPFLRLDTIDDERTHWDLREASVNVYAGNVSARVGISKVYWGVTETHQLVDIVNQYDQVEEPRGTEKLGQPMVMLRGEFDGVEATALLLPAFRERTFPGVEGRLRAAIPIDNDSVRYESNAEDHRLDTAFRLKARIDDFDIGLSYFDGTSREPRFEYEGGKLVPVYDVIDQYGLDAQATLGDTLLKLEAISRDGHGGAGARSITALVAGIEYTLSQVCDSATDVGLVLEYNYDDRPASAPPTIYNNDFFVGARFAFNDVDDSNGFLGALLDAGDGSVYARLEASTRLQGSLRLEIEGEFALYVNDADAVLYQIKNDSFITVRLKQYL